MNRGAAFQAAAGTGVGGLAVRVTRVVACVQCSLAGRAQLPTHPTYHQFH